MVSHTHTHSLPVLMQNGGGVSVEPSLVGGPFRAFRGVPGRKSHGIPPETQMPGQDSWGREAGD